MLYLVTTRAATAAAVSSTAIAATAESTLARRRRRCSEGNRHRFLAAQVEAALAVDLGRLDHDLISDVGHFLNPLDPMVGELGDVHEAVLVGQHFHEGAEGHDAHYLALVDPADLDLVGQALDPVDRTLAALLVDRRDEDATVVLDVDLRARLLGDLSNHLASGADDVADLVGVDHDRGDARRVGAHLAAGLRKHREHLVQHEQPRFASLLERLREDLVREALYLDVHLQGGDSVTRAGDLEVHVTEVVLDALDVGQHSELALSRDKTHGDARHR